MGIYAGERVFAGGGAELMLGKMNIRRPTSNDEKARMSVRRKACRYGFSFQCIPRLLRGGNEGGFTCGCALVDDS